MMLIQHFHPAPFNIVVNSANYTRLGTLWNDVDSTFPSNTVQHCREFGELNAFGKPVE